MAPKQGTGFVVRFALFYRQQTFARCRFFLCGESPGRSGLRIHRHIRFGGGIALFDEVPHQLGDVDAELI